MNPRDPLPAVKVLPRRPALAARPTAKRIGLLVLATDHTTERDYARAVAAQGIAVHATRVAYANPTTPENLRRMQPRLTEAAELILPGEELDAVCFSCSSASAVIGDEAVAAAIQEAKPGTQVITPPLATVRGLRALGARRIGILTPYTAETTRPVVDYFTARGFAVASVSCLGMDDDREMARIAPGTLASLARDVADPSVDALFISCTALRAAEAAAAIEDKLGRPVVTSNQATTWNVLRLCGISVPRPEWGHLMTLPISPDPSLDVPA